MARNSWQYKIVSVGFACLLPLGAAGGNCKPANSSATPSGTTGGGTTPPAESVLVKEFKSVSRMFSADTSDIKFVHGEFHESFAILLKANISKDIPVATVRLQFESSSNKVTLSGVGFPKGSNTGGAALTPFEFTYTIQLVGGHTDDQLLVTLSPTKLAGEMVGSVDATWPIAQSNFIWSKSKKALRTMLVYNPDSKAAIKFNAFDEFDASKAEFDPVNAIEFK